MEKLTRESGEVLGGYRVVQANREAAEEGLRAWREAEQGWNGSAEGVRGAFLGP